MRDAEHIDNGGAELVAQFFVGEGWQDHLLHLLDSGGGGLEVWVAVGNMRLSRRSSCLPSSPFIAVAR